MNMNQPIKGKIVNSTNVIHIGGDVIKEGVYLLITNIFAYRKSFQLFSLFSFIFPRNVFY